VSTATATEVVPGPRRAVHRASPLTVGVVVFLSSELMFFSSLFAAYFTMRAINSPWPPPGSEIERLRPLIFTLALVLSSGTVQMAVRAIARGDIMRFRRWIFATMALGVAFVGNQAIEWSTAPFTPASHAFGSAFFTMTGFHGFHVTAGILAMAVLLGRSGARRFGSGELPSVEVVSYYWHFVDVVWVVMFTVLFYVR